MAQLAEQLTCNEQVVGSIPTVGFVSEMGATHGKTSSGARNAIKDRNKCEAPPAVTYNFIGEVA